jgi:hypothetical protein
MKSNVLTNFLVKINQNRRRSVRTGDGRRGVSFLECEWYYGSDHQSLSFDVGYLQLAYPILHPWVRTTSPYFDINISYINHVSYNNSYGVYNGKSDPNRNTPFLTE